MKPITFHTRFCDETAAVIRKGQYHDGSIALRVFDQFGEPLTTATVCMSAYDQTPHEGCVFIKEHGENEGVLAALQDAGVVGPTLRTLDAAMVDDYAHECRLLADLNQIGDM
jgi:hypothetical protein